MQKLLLALVLLIGLSMLAAMVSLMKPIAQPAAANSAAVENKEINLAVYAKKMPQLFTLVIKQSSGLEQREYKFSPASAEKPGLISVPKKWLQSGLADAVLTFPPGKFMHRQFVYRLPGWNGADELFLSVAVRTDFVCVSAWTDPAGCLRSTSQTF